MDAVQPRFQIGKNEVDDGQKVVGNLGIATLGDGMVVVPPLPQACISAPIVRNRECSRSDGVLDKPTKRRGASVRHDGEPDATGIASVPSLLLRGPRFAMTHLDAAGDENLVV